MPLPHELAPGLYINGLAKAMQDDRPTGKNHSQIGGNNVSREEQFYTCTYLPPQAGVQRRPAYQITANNPNLLKRNFLYVSNFESGVAMGILPRALVDTHVFSDNFGGCEFHVLSRQGGVAAAFLHVYRGGGKTVQYTIDPNSDWEHRATLQSSVVTAGLNTMATVVAYAFVPAGGRVAECCFLTMDSQYRVSGIHGHTTVNLT